MARVEDHRHKSEVREAGTRRFLVVYQNVRLFSDVSAANSKRCGNTDAFEVTIYKVRLMNVLQTLDHTMQLRFLNEAG